VVTSLPVDVLAVEAAQEALMLLVNVNGNPKSHRLSIHGFEPSVATHAPGEALPVLSGIRREMEFTDDLPQLLLPAVALDQGAVPCEFPLGEAKIASQQYAIFFYGAFQQLRVIQRWLVDGIDTQHPQPPGQLPQHGVSDEPRFRAGLIGSG